MDNNLLAKNNENIFDRIKNRVFSFWKRLIKNIDIDSKEVEGNELVHKNRSISNSDNNNLNDIYEFKSNETEENVSKNSENVEQKIKEINLNREREKFLENLINNPELFDAMSKENLIKLNRYYDHMISENEKKIKKMKNN